MPGWSCNGSAADGGSTNAAMVHTEGTSSTSMYLTHSPCRPGADASKPTVHASRMARCHEFVRETHDDARMSVTHGHLWLLHQWRQQYETHPPPRWPCSPAQEAPSHTRPPTASWALLACQTSRPHAQVAPAARGTEMCFRAEIGFADTWQSLRHVAHLRALNFAACFCHASSVSDPSFFPYVILLIFMCAVSADMGWC